MTEKTKGLVARLTALRQNCDEQHVTKDFADFITRISAHTEKPFSFNNLLLAFAETNGKATELHSLRTWNNLGKRVRKGSKGVKILLPRVWRKLNEDGTETNIRYYSVGYLFDIKDVEAAPVKAA
ncbi:MAG: hypothetical protein AABZ39_04870 [Spirochaetota bacterium]